MSTEPFDKTKLIPARMRAPIARGEPPIYYVTRPDLDRLPLNTFLVRAMMSTEGRVLQAVFRLVWPRDPSQYRRETLTPNKRLLYGFWTGGMAVKRLADAQAETWRHIVLPTDPGFDLIDGFKIQCDTRRSVAGRPVRTSPTLLYKALGLEPPELSGSDTHDPS